MKPIFQQFSVKLSLLFLLLIVTMGVVQMLISMNITEKRQVAADQLVNLNLARDMVREIEPQLRGSSENVNIGPIIHYMMVMNPQIEIYLLDNEGKILSFFAEPGVEVKEDHVDLEPIKAFLKDNHAIPLYGSDPRNPGQKKHFSAATIKIGENMTGYLYIVLRSSLYDRALHMLRERYFLSTLNKSFLLSLLFVGIAGLILFAFLTKRIQKVSSAVKDFENGNYSRRTAIKSRDEIGYLGQAFNQMADTIVAQLEQLKNTDRLRRELVANVSHDLKSPLTSIQGYIETLLIKDDTLSSEDRRRFLNTALHSTQSLNQLVWELFELSKLDAKQAEPKVEQFSISELAQDVFMKFKPVAEKMGIDLSVQIPEDLCMIEADIAMIERTMSNLLDNALRHTPPQGTVLMELKPLEQKVRFAVTDTGSGIPSSDIDQVFDRFFVGDKNRRRTEEGSGLGLAISKRIIELHGGTIGVESRLNTGSTFYFDLPVENR
jgi:signal transduction histidine kinase